MPPKQTAVATKPETQPTTSQPEPKPANLPAPLQIAQQLDKMKPQIAAVLPSHIKPEQFNRVAMTAINNNPDLVTAERRSLFNSCNRCAADGLLPDGREAALVVFGGKVQYMPMVFGIIKKLRNSGEIASITARLVFENELKEGRFSFLIDEGTERLKHEPLLIGDRGKPALVYATAKFRDGTVQNEVMTVADVEKVRNASRAKNSGPWTQWWDEMARKTVIRRLSKYLPLSAEDQRVLDRDIEPTEFTELRQNALETARPQSIDAARMLGAPEPDTDASNDEPTEAQTTEAQTIDAETGEVIDEPNAIPVTLTDAGETDWPAFISAAKSAIAAAPNAAWLDRWQAIHKAALVNLQVSDAAGHREIADAVKAKGGELGREAA